MTRINLVPPEELADQHLFAEFREIKMIPKSLARSLKAAYARGETLEQFKRRIPKEYTLNTGHVLFFYDKGFYLRQRYLALKKELLHRGINFNVASKFDPDEVYPSLTGKGFNKDYAPTKKALVIIRSRIAEKIAMKPTWYKYQGQPLTKHENSSHNITNRRKTSVELLSAVPISKEGYDALKEIL